MAVNLPVNNSSTGRIHIRLTRAPLSAVCALDLENLQKKNDNKQPQKVSVQFALLSSLLEVDRHDESSNTPATLSVIDFVLHDTKPNGGDGPEDDFSSFLSSLVAPALSQTNGVESSWWRSLFPTEKENHESLLGFNCTEYDNEALEKANGDPSLIYLVFFHIQSSQVSAFVEKMLQECETVFQSEQESGMLRYDLWQSVQDEQQFCVFEVCKDQEAMDFHEARRRDGTMRAFLKGIEETSRKKLPWTGRYTTMKPRKGWGLRWRR